MKTKRRPIHIKRKVRRLAMLALALFIVLICITLARIADARKTNVFVPESIVVENVQELGRYDIGYNDFQATKEIMNSSKPEKEQFKASFTDEEIKMAAKCVWGEARGIESQMEQAAIVWCFLNRVDKYDKSLGEVVVQRAQFNYDESFPVFDDYGRNLINLVQDVISRWEMEKNGYSDVGRVLPKEYTYFGGDGHRNYFRTEYENFDNIWDWSLPNPYES